RFVASTGQRVTLFEPVGRADPYHENRFLIEKRGYAAQFRTGDFTNAEKQFVIDNFKFNGIGLQEDAIHPLDPSFRIFTFDTDQINWEPYAEDWGMSPGEFKEAVEQKLQASVYHGTDFVRFDAPALEPPWKGYDRLKSVARIVALTKETGSDPEDVI